MRGRRRALTCLILLGALILGALSISLGGWLAFRWVGLRSVRVAAVVVLLGGALDAARVRPLDAHRQVPQAWGHRHGPMLAAARYGVRLGVGPATILASWLWWSTFVIGCWSAWGVATTAAVAFALARFAVMFAIATGSTDGVAMAHRMSLWRAAEGRVRRIGIATVTTLAVIVLIRGNR